MPGDPRVYKSPNCGILGWRGLEKEASVNAAMHHVFFLMFHFIIVSQTVIFSCAKGRINHRNDLITF